jgi:ADP-L-glycero-D-manno-heptose 6-epimerase
MIIVTGGAGFIGSNIVRLLNESESGDVIVVDDLTDGRKALNLADCDIADYFDKDDFLLRIREDDPIAPEVTAILHQGACSVTTEWDGQFMMETNFEYSKQLFHFAQRRSIPFIYASSASVYGTGKASNVARECERPVNAYAFSKLTFDQYVRRFLPESTAPVVGLRYFNVYGPREAHKGGMASVIYHFDRQLREGDEVRLFEGNDGYANGEQRRDFIHVDDVAAVNLWFLDRVKGDPCSGIYNLGTGQSRTFNDVATAVIAWHGRGKIRYIPFPDHLRDSYQSFTEADMAGLRAIGYTNDFLGIEEGVQRYLQAIEKA